jgi:hypothetical protein
MMMKLPALDTAACNHLCKLLGMLGSAHNKSVGAATSTLKLAQHLVHQGDPKRVEGWLRQRSPAERTAILKHFEDAK